MQLETNDALDEDRHTRSLPLDKADNVKANHSFFD
jgi:hypothetical protein